MITGRKYDIVGSDKLPDTNADARNRIFIKGDSIVKYVRGYKLSRLESYKVYVKSFFGWKDDVYEGLCKSNNERNALACHSP